jgi:hypothetical protein
MVQVLIRWLFVGTLSLGIVGVIITLASLLLPPENKPQVLGAQDTVSELRIRDDEFAFELTTLQGRSTEYSLPHALGSEDLFDRVEITDEPSSGTMFVNSTQKLVYTPHTQHTGGDTAEMLLCKGNKCTGYDVFILIQPMTMQRYVQLITLDGKWNIGSLLAFTMLAGVSGACLWYARPKKLRISYQEYPSY